VSKNLEISNFFQAVLPSYFKKENDYRKIKRFRPDARGWVKPSRKFGKLYEKNGRANNNAELNERLPTNDSPPERFRRFGLSRISFCNLRLD